MEIYDIESKVLIVVPDSGKNIKKAFNGDQISRFDTVETDDDDVHAVERFPCAAHNKQLAINDDEPLKFSL